MYVAVVSTVMSQLGSKFAVSCIHELAVNITQFLNIH